MKQSSLDLALDLVVDQAVFAAAVGISEARVSQLVADGTLRKGDTARAWLLGYCERLREQAAGRGYELTVARTKLADAQREQVEIKNATLRGTYADVQLLAEVLATASQSVAEDFDHLPGQLRTSCPDLPAAAIDKVLEAIAKARNTWVTRTAALVAETIASAGDDDEPRPD